MVNLEEYKKSEDKVKYFHSLSNKEKNILWDELKGEKNELWSALDVKGKKSLISLLSLKQINEFMISLSELERIDALKFFDQNKLRGYNKRSNNEIRNDVSKPLKTDNKLEKKDIINDGVKAIQSLSETGVNFNYPAVVPKTVVNVGDSKEKDVLGVLDVEQIVTMCAVLQAYVQKQEERKKKIEIQEEQEKEKTSGVVKTLTKSSGNVSLGLLAGIIFFLLMVMFLFF